MQLLQSLKNVDFKSIPIDPFWNTGDAIELKMHRIHAYPAKFPAFITTKALEYAEEKGLSPRKIADIFCGCGTVAFEAKRNNIDFWGCDINPVATMIASTKSTEYNTKIVEKYLEEITRAFPKMKVKDDDYKNANERLKYWYKKKQFLNVLKLKKAIAHTVPKRSKYNTFFTCAFSNILKPTSKWLTKSIKPQVDPNKPIVDVLETFINQCHFMMRAYAESDVKGSSSNTEVINTSFLSKELKRPKVDMIITSPPYVTSYEYADLHQLSSLWLSMCDDHRNLRNGSIGTLHDRESFNFKKESKRLNEVGTQIVFQLLEKDRSQAQAVARYFLDMQRVTKECHSMLKKDGIALFVIGNTEYKGVRMDNARHLAEAMQNSGFQEISASKRRITNKFLTPYRDKVGKFTTDKSGRKIYSEEFIIVGRK